MWKILTGQITQGIYYCRKAAESRGRQLEEQKEYRGGTNGNQDFKKIIAMKTEKRMT